MSRRRRDLHSHRETLFLNRKDQKTWIYYKWQKKWLTDKRKRKEEDSFFKLFSYDYVYTCNQHNYYKKKDAHAKFLCKFPLALATILFFFAVFVKNFVLLVQVGGFDNFTRHIDWSFSLFSLFLYVSILVICYVMSKCLETGKHQEAMRRYLLHRYEIDREMFRYITNMGEYAGENRRQNFMKNIMFTWDDDQDMIKRLVRNIAE